MSENHANMRPRRSHWGRRIGWAALLLVVGLFVVFVAWSGMSERQLERGIESLVAAGEPILPEHFEPKLPDGPDNAAKDLRAAAELVRADKSDAARARDDLRDVLLPFRDDERAILAKVVENSADAFALVDSAKTKPRCDWVYGLKSPVIQTPVFPELSGLRQVAVRLSDAAKLDHERGDDASTLARIDRILFISRSLERNAFLVGHLVATGVGLMGAGCLRECTPELRIGDRAGDASPRDVRRLIETLLDDVPSRDGYKLAMRGERMMGLDTMRAHGNGMPIAGAPGGTSTTRSKAMSLLLRPYFNSNARLIVEHLTRIIPLAEEPNWPTARAKTPPLPPAVAQRSPMALLAAIYLPSIDGAILSHHRAMTDRRMTATLLAVRWYVTEHDGKLPAKLDDLVPRYIASVPLDPMTLGTALRYEPDSDDPILYSAGTNGTDEGGSEKPARARTGVSPRYDEWELEDRVFHLKRLPRPARESDETPPPDP